MTQYKYIREAINPNVKLTSKQVGKEGRFFEGLKKKFLPSGRAGVKKRKGEMEEAWGQIHAGDEALKKTRGPVEKNYKKQMAAAENTQARDLIDAGHKQHIKQLDQIDLAQAQQIASDPRHKAYRQDVADVAKADPVVKGVGLLAGGLALRQGHKMHKARKLSKARRKALGTSLLLGGSVGVPMVVASQMDKQSSAATIEDSLFEELENIRVAHG